MKGYTTQSGYMGYIDGDYMLFACEDDYREYYMNQKKRSGSMRTASSVSCYLISTTQPSGASILHS